MNIPVTHTSDGRTFTLTLHGKPQQYTSDKAGKRQAILDGLAALETVTIGPDTYLPVNQSLEVVAAVLYPDGIQTEAAYRTVTRTAEKACARLGYGEEVILDPPVVAFGQRGVYRKRFPPVEAQLVLDILTQAGTSSYVPRQEIACAIVWNKAAQTCYGRHWSRLTDTEKQRIETQVAAIVAGAAEWEDDLSGSGCYFRPLPVDETAARRRLEELLRRENGCPVTVGRIISQAQMGAYGRGFYTSELAPALQAVVAEVLSAHGYAPTPHDDQYWPEPPVLKVGTAVEIEEAIAAIEPVATQNGHVLLLDTLAAALAGGGKVHWLGRQRIRLNGMKAHVRLQATLPCGWANHILIHKQASLKEMNPEQPFYLLDDGTQPIPPLFYPMLNKCLALPLLPEWAAYLWENGRRRELVTLLNEGEGQGYAAWRVLPSAEEWQGVIQDGLQSQAICF